MTHEKLKLSALSVAAPNWIEVADLHVFPRTTCAACNPRIPEEKRRRGTRLRGGRPNRISGTDGIQASVPFRSTPATCRNTRTRRPSRPTESQSAFLYGTTAEAQRSGSPEVGIHERIGTTLSLDTTLWDEDGNTIALRDAVNLPTLLVFVYYRCPAICDPLLRELARNLDQLELGAGREYRVVTISFDPTETPVRSRDPNLPARKLAHLPEP